MASSQVQSFLTNVNAKGGLSSPTDPSQIALQMQNGVSQAASSRTNRNGSSRKDVLSAAQGRADPLMNFNWYAQMPSISPYNGQTYNLSWEFVEECTIPFPEFDQSSNYRAGKQFHYPNHNSVGTFGVKIYEDVKGTATSYLKAWQASMFNPATGLYYYPNDYKKTIQVYVLDVTNRSVMVIDYIGCWPMRFDPVNLGSAQSERIIMGAEFSVDTVNIKVGKFNEGSFPSALSGVGNNFPAFPTAIPNIFPSEEVSFSF